MIQEIKDEILKKANFDNNEIFLYYVIIDCKKTALQDELIEKSIHKDKIKRLLTQIETEKIVKLRWLNKSPSKNSLIQEKPIEKLNRLSSIGKPDILIFYPNGYAMWKSTSLKKGNIHWLDELKIMDIVEEIDRPIKHAVYVEGTYYFKKFEMKDPFIPFVRVFERKIKVVSNSLGSILIIIYLHLMYFKGVISKKEAEERLFPYFLSTLGKVYYRKIIPGVKIYLHNKQFFNDVEKELIKFKKTGQIKDIKLKEYDVLKEVLDKVPKKLKTVTEKIEYINKLLAYEYVGEKMKLAGEKIEGEEEKEKWGWEIPEIPKEDVIKEDEPEEDVNNKFI